MGPPAYLLTHSGEFLDYVANARCPLAKADPTARSAALDARSLIRPRAPERTPKNPSSLLPANRAPQRSRRNSACANAAQAQRAHEQQASDQTRQNGDQQAEHGESDRKPHTAA